MEIIEVTPYQKIEKRVFNDDLTLLIKKENFDNQEFIDGRSTFFVSGCDFKKVLIENNDEIDFKILISFSGCYVHDLQITAINSQKINIHFFSTILSGIVKNNKLQSLSISNCILDKALFAININAVNISFTEENIFPIIWRNIITRTGLQNFDELLKHSQSYFLDNVKTINFYTHEIQSNIRGLKVEKDSLIADYKMKYYLTEEQKRGFSIQLDIKYGLDFNDVETKINNPYLYSLSLSGHPKGKITVEDGKIQRLYIYNLSPQNDLTFYNIRPLLNLKKLAKIEIHKSNLKNTWFDNFNFSEYSTISFFRTRFSETSFTSCGFPTDSISFENFRSLENVHYPAVLKDSFHKDQYETFLQLKNALEKSGNIYEAQKLQAISFEALGKIKDVSSWDKFILFLNDFSNQHGLSISRPLKWLFVFSIFLYLCYLYSLDLLFTNTDIDLTLVGYYFSFLDITHRSDFLVEKVEFTAMALTLDFLNKVVVGYFVYQFIASFRKYGKRK